MIKERLNDKWARIIIIPAIALLISFSGDGFRYTSLQVFILEAGLSLAYVTCYWELNRLFFSYIRKRLPDTKDSKRRFTFQLAFMAFFVLVAGLFLDIVNYSLPGLTTSISFIHLYSKTVEKSLFFLGLVTLIFEGLYFYSLYENSRSENQRLKEEALISQLSLLKQQISPHFLFNNLNALITLIPKDPALSVVFLQKLSAVYRQLLNDNEKDLVSLESEIRFLDDYLFLNQMRFGKNLLVNYDIRNGDKQHKIIPFALQLAVENALKHNIISSAHPLSVGITSDGYYVTVSNNLQKKTSGVISSHTGLKNIRNRYGLLTTNEVIVKTDDKFFSVSLPLIS
jgi:two-component system LytT family sensor kinase